MSCPFSGKAAINNVQDPKHPTPPACALRSHGYGQRNGDEQPTGGIVAQGKFGRMFPTLYALRSNDDAMDALAAVMVSATPDENPTIPAGFTYLGQFIDHDITLDTTGLSEQIADPTAVSNFRTPRLDLDSIYGRGPVADPHLYERLDPERMQIGVTNAARGGGEPDVKPSLRFDLPRATQGLAVIGDPRNDENLVVAQTHLALLRFHNKLLDQVRASGTIVLSAFEDTRRLVQWHYQWVVLNDFLRRILDPAILDDVLANGRQFYRFEEQSALGEPYIPLEFSVAAYRLGHSMVRGRYDYNSVFRQEGVTPATLELLFRFSGLSSAETDPAAFANDIPIPSDWIIDWSRWYQIDGTTPVNLAFKIDPFLVQKLHNLNRTPVGGVASLAARNLRRGLKMGLPSAQDVAAFMSVPLLTPAQLTSGPDGAKLQELGLDTKTPLWYYILKEAEQTANGEHLGALGSRIVAEVFVGMLEGDPGSFLSMDKNWVPTLGSGGVSFNMAELLTFTGDLNPVDDPANRGT
jgi:hypothetical protein